MKRNLFIAALALLTTMGAGVAQAQYRDRDRVAADIIGIRLGNNLSITARLNDRRAYDDDRFWCSELHRRYDVQEVVLLERRRSGLSWLDILDDLLWASSHRNDRYDRRTVVYYPQYIERYNDRYTNVRVNVRDHIGREWDDRRWNDRDRDDRWRNDRDRDDRWRNDHRNDHDRDDHARNDRDRDNRNRNDRNDRDDRNRNDRHDNNQGRNNQGRNDRQDNTNRNRDRDRNQGGGRNIGNIRG